MTEKTRILQVATWQRPSAFIQSGTIRATGPYPLESYNLVQRTVSDGHPFATAKYRGYRGRDLGGPFETERYIWDPEYTKLFTQKPSGTWYVDGNIYAMPPNIMYLKDRVSRTEDSVMDSWGTSAISQVIPTKAPVDLASSAAELVSGGLPKLIGSGLLKSQLKDFRKVGDEYLNWEFGIKPLIGDIQGTAKAIVSAAERIKQLERDSGRLVRRRFTFPDRREIFETNATGAAAVPSGWTNTGLWVSFSGNRRRTTTTYETKRWFSGAFTYYLNLGERQRSQLYNAADNARLLLGVKLDAEVLWNLTPWSWLADWFGNVGDIATNVSHFSRDGLVMPYGYIMAESSVMEEHLLYDLSWRDPTGPRSVRDKAGYVRKQRRAATPFGFGLSDMVLDTRQLSILNALGISKVPRR